MSQVNSQGTSGDSQQRASLATWAGFFGMCVGMFMAILDIQIVVTSLPAIRDALDIADDRMSWIQTSYLIAEVIAISLTGILTRAFSIRGLFLLALATFTGASIACAGSTDFWLLVAARVVQGFAGGCLIPLVFSSVFLLFSEKEQGIATTIAGALAVLAPTLGPSIGGYITQTYSWPWLFLVNVGPGVGAVLVGWCCLPRHGGTSGLLRQIDIIALLALCLSLIAIKVGLKEAPQVGWVSVTSVMLFSLSAFSALVFILRSLQTAYPLLELRLLRFSNTAVAGVVSFVFGAGLFASIYLMVVFLGLVRLYDPLEIGLIIIVTGVAQLLVAPIVVQLELRYDARILTAIGLALFGWGLIASSGQTRVTDFDEMFWPQVIRGVGIMLCLIPPTRLALDHLSDRDIPDGSALFNVLRNLGGAIGIALVDTIMWQRTPFHADALVTRLAARDMDAVDQVGIPRDMMPAEGVEPTPRQIELGTPLVERAALVEAINEAWLVLGVVTLATLIVLPWARSSRRSA